MDVYIRLLSPPTCTIAIVWLSGALLLSASVFDLGG